MKAQNQFAVKAAALNTRRNKERPTIGVTTSRKSGWRVFPLIALNLWLVGVRAVRWTYKSDVDLDAVDGVIIGGGDDISPDLYDGQLSMTARLDPERDAMEHSISLDAMRRGLPVLGICRGAQMLNVSLGGTLDQDAWKTFPDAKPIKTILPRRTVLLERQTRLFDIVGPGPMRVNALHTQAVDRLGEGLRISATDTFGMVQAIERVEEPFALGVQWHPEHLPYAHRQRAIFRALATAAEARMGGRSQIGAVEREAIA